MISISINLWCFCLLLLSSVVYAEYAIYDNTAYAKANACARNCAAWEWGYQGIALCDQYENDASCLCETANGYSSSMNVQLSLCPAITSCGGTFEASQAVAIFSAYCSMNGVGAAAVATTAADSSNPTNAPATGQTPATAFATPTSDASGSTSGNNDNNNNNNSSNSNGLSMSDKIAIACAIGGAVVTIAVAVPTWYHMRKKKRASQVPEAQPLHPPPAYMGPTFANPMQQPLYPQQRPYQPHIYQNSGWQGGWRS